MPDPEPPNFALGNPMPDDKLRPGAPAYELLKLLREDDGKIADMLGLLRMFKALGPERRVMKGALRRLFEQRKRWRRWSLQQLSPKQIAKVALDIRSAPMSLVAAATGMTPIRTRKLLRGIAKAPLWWEVAALAQFFMCSSDQMGAMLARARERQRQAAGEPKPAWHPEEIRRRVPTITQVKEVHLDALSRLDYAQRGTPLRRPGGGGQLAQLPPELGGAGRFGSGGYSGRHAAGVAPAWGETIEGPPPSALRASGSPNGGQLRAGGPRVPRGRPDLVRIAGPDGGAVVPAFGLAGRDLAGPVPDLGPAGCAEGPAGGASGAQGA